MWHPRNDGTFSSAQAGNALSTQPHSTRVDPHADHPPRRHRPAARSDERHALCRGGAGGRRASDLRPGQRHLCDGRRGDAGRQAPRRLPQARRRGEGRARAGCCLRRQRDLRPCRRHLVSLLDVEPRPGRQHREPDQHGAARHLHARQPRIRFRQGGVSRAHGGGDVSALRRQPAQCRRRDAAGLPGPLDRDRRRRAHRADRRHLRGQPARVRPRRPQILILGRNAHRAGEDAAARGRRLRGRGRACHPRAGLRALSQRHDRSHPHRPHPRSLHQL